MNRKLREEDFASPEEYGYYLLNLLSGKYLQLPADVIHCLQDKKQY